MDIVRLYQDFNVDYVTENHRHARPGWANTKCPFCTGNEGFHLGWNISEEYYYCYRCGWHAPVQTISSLINVSKHDAVLILQRYGINRTLVQNVVKTQGKPLILPTNLTGLTHQHKKYLKGRGYDADMLEKKWGLQSTGPLSKVEGVPYKHRIFIPYYWNGQLVTFDTRDATDRAINKYQACPVDREIMHRKDILYGNQEMWNGTGICVEGPGDVWRFGDFAFGTSGTSFTPTQVRLIAKIFKHVFISFDNKSETSKELQAQVKARELRSELRFRGVKAELAPVPFGDPGSMLQSEADKFVKSLIG